MEAGQPVRLEAITSVATSLGSGLGLRVRVRVRVRVWIS
jgi:hypothetical protein